MNSGYEKHQRDYTVLVVSIIGNWFFSDEFAPTFAYKANPIFALVEKGVFYHLVNVADYAGTPEGYFKKNNYEDFKKFIADKDKLLLRYRKFLDSDHGDILKSLDELHFCMKAFMSVSMIVTYAPEYIENLNKQSLDLCLNARVRYEDVHRLGMNLQKNLLNKLESQLGLKKDILEYLTTSEYSKFVKTKKIPAGLDKRKDFLFLEYSSRGEKFYSKKESEKILDKIDKTRNIKTDIAEIKGNTAYAGCVKGKVRLIRLITEASRLEEGEILVVSMTDPRYVPAMKKAAAIVTDEGGIMCHAAIVAREMEKPCVIGTKIATKVLKDGDMVEVDANRGIVRKL